MASPAASPLESSRLKARMRARFARHAATYERHAGLQRAIAARLASHLPAHESPHLLEIGCGTGFLTRHLLERYPDGHLLVTDIAPEMVAACQTNFEGAAKARFAVLDGEAPPGDTRFDLIVSSMVLQWFDDPSRGLERLRARLSPGGVLLYAASGPDFLREWTAVMRELGFALDDPPTAALPGVFDEERTPVAYGSARDLLSELRGTGAARPLGPGRRLTPHRLREAMTAFDRRHQARATWHVLYGRLDGERCPRP